jgi:hypothetical protein
MGFELWEVLTAFTVALTLASILMWYSNIQPRQNQESYLWQNQEKNSLYNIWLRADYVQKKMTSSYIVQNIDGDCGENLIELEISKDANQSQIDDIQSLIGRSKTLESKISDNKSGLRSDPDFKSISSNLTQYLENVVKTQNNKLQVSQTLLDTQKLLSETCQNFYIIPESKNWLIDSLAEQIKSSSTDQAKLTLKDIKDIKDIYSKSEEPLDDEDREKLNSKFKAIWETDYQDLLDSSGLWEDKNSILDNLKNYEKWEKEYSLNKDYLITRSVYIWPD